MIPDEQYPSLEDQKIALINYLKVQLARNDWHGVSDAVNDIRVIEAQIAIQDSLKYTAKPTPFCACLYEEAEKCHRIGNPCECVCHKSAMVDRAMGRAKSFSCICLAKDCGFAWQEYNVRPDVIVSCPKCGNTNIKGHR